MKKNILAILILLGFVIYGAYDYIGERNVTQTGIGEETGADETVETGLQKGQRAPDFQLEDLEGSPVLLSDFRGKKVFLNFWATWCPPCRWEMPDMQQVYVDNGGDVVILGVNLTTTEMDPGTVAPFLEEFGLTFPVVLDEEGDVMAMYQVTAYPTTYAIDSRGIIREKFRGAINTEMMDETIKLMNKKLK